MLMTIKMTEELYLFVSVEWQHFNEGSGKISQWDKFLQ